MFEGIGDLSIELNNIQQSKLKDDFNCKFHI